LLLLLLLYIYMCKCLMQMLKVQLKPVYAAAAAASDQLPAHLPECCATAAADELLIVCFNANVQGEAEALHNCCCCCC
jgi:hypothetical protein